MTIHPNSFFPHEFGWIDGKCPLSWNGGRCDTEQCHRQHRTAKDRRIARIRLIHDLPQEAAREDARQQPQQRFPPVAGSS